MGKGDQARGPDKWAEQNREERTPLEEMPRLGLAYVKNKNKNKNKTKTKAKTKKTPYPYYVIMSSRIEV